MTLAGWHINRHPLLDGNKHGMSGAVLNSYIDHALLINQSYQHWTGQYLISTNDPEEVLVMLNTASFAVVSHGLETPPVFNYGNLLALQIFEYSFEQFIQLPSQESANPAQRDERAAMFDKLKTTGYDDSYSGVRVTASGREFTMQNAEVWTLVDPMGRTHGHAAKFSDWHYL
jgi:hypothetical protein